MAVAGWRLTECSAFAGMAARASVWCGGGGLTCRVGCGHQTRGCQSRSLPQISGRPPRRSAGQLRRLWCLLSKLTDWLAASVLGCQACRWCCPRTILTELAGRAVASRAQRPDRPNRRRHRPSDRVGASVWHTRPRQVLMMSRRAGKPRVPAIRACEGREMLEGDVQVTG